MCGIIGAASVRPRRDRQWLGVGRDLMRHRGPDDSGEWWSEDGRVGFGHRRLSIIDLSPAGHQPMVRSEYNLAITFNGEIYNFRELRRELESLGYQFQGSSDTEVALLSYRAWGKECVLRFNGMFSFAVYDGSREIVFIARDRAGEKPLFYSINPRKDELLFSSELKGLMANPELPRSVDRRALDCYLAFGFIPSPLCILEGTYKLEPGHALTFDIRSGGLSKWRYWKVPRVQGDSRGQGDDELLDELESLLEDSVARQLVADVPVGILLSGGLDSSLVAAMAVRRSSSVKTFTVSFPGHDGVDEANHALRVARHFGTQHMVLEAQATSADIVPQLAHQFDEPMADSSMVPTWLVSNLVRQHCAVALGGDGGDELFGGYSHYSRMLRMQRYLTLVPTAFRRAAASFARHRMPTGSKGRNWLMAAGTDFDRDVPFVAFQFDEVDRRKLFADGPIDSVAESYRANRVPRGGGLLERAMLADFGAYLPEDILVKVDRASMLNSLEVRAPLLDCRLIEFAASRLPSRLKATHDNKKIMLKRLARRVLPADFDLHRKQGFSVPMRAWLEGGPFRELFEKVLTDPGCAFDVKYIRELLRGQDEGRNNGERLFALVLFELWRREYRVSL